MLQIAKVRFQTFSSGLNDEILAKYPEVARRLRKGLSIRDAAGACGVSVSTVQKVKKAMK